MEEKSFDANNVQVNDTTCLRKTLHVQRAHCVHLTLLFILTFTVSNKIRNSHIVLYKSVQNCDV